MGNPPAVAAGEFAMRLSHRVIALILSPAGLALSSAMTGWATTAKEYDPFWHDYHRWSYGEDRRYRQWEMGSNRAHLAFHYRTPGDQLVYWSWRHSWKHGRPRPAGFEPVQHQAGQLPAQLRSQERVK